MDGLKERAVSGLILMLLLTSMLTSAFIIQPVKAEPGTIYIRADGSVDPPTAPIQRGGDIYTLTETIYYSEIVGSAIVVERNNIIIDGAGYAVRGIGVEGVESSKGINLYSVKNVTLKRTNIQGFVYAVTLDQGSEDNKISGNNITNSNCGVLLYPSYHNIVSGNIIENCTSAVYLSAGSFSNHVNNNVIVVGSPYRRQVGIELYFSDYNDIYNNTITGTEGYVDISLRSSSYNEIDGNKLAANGIWLSWNSSNNLIIQNNLTAIRPSYRIGFYNSSNNDIYHNNFITNRDQIDITDSVNDWDNGYPSGGNYWSNYTGVDLKSGPNQDQPGSDGVGDTQYIIDADNRDRYPLMNPWTLSRPRVGLVLATGGLGDKSLNDVTWAGVKRAEEELGIYSDYVEPTAIAEYEGYQRAFAATGAYEIIICVGFDQADALTKVAAEYPSQRFAIVDGVVDKPNVASLLFKANEGSFLAGVIAGMKTHSGEIGFVGAMDIPLVRDYFMGYQAGAKWANPAVEVVSPVFVGGWADPAKGKELALELIDLGVDVIYGEAGKSGLGVLQAVHERGILGLGVDACQCFLYPEVIASMTKRVDVAAFDMIKATIYETFQGGIYNGGLKEGWVGCCRLPEEESFWEEMFRFTHAFLDTSVIDKIDEARDKIVAGEITVPPTRVRAPGVAPGQFLHYSASMTITGNDTELIPHILPQGWANVTVLSVSGVNVTYQTVFYNATTKTSRTDTLNIESGLINGSSTVFPGPFLAANLSAGDPIYTALPYYLNETVTADYLGLHLETDHLILSENQTNSNAYGYIFNTTQTQHCYWERKTGIWLDWFVEGNTSRPDGAGGVLVTYIQYRVLILSAIARRMIPGKDVPTETPDFFPSVLAKLNIPASQFALQAFSIWTNYENTNAYWNPLATTWNMGEKSWNFNWAGVKNYADKETGIQATANTLALNYYESIREMLAIQSFNEQHLREAVATWSGLDPNDAYVVNLVNEWRNIYPVSLNQPPFASFTYSPESPFYSGDLVSFNAFNSYDPDGSIVSYRWGFGDGMTAEGKIASHRFRGAQNEPKTYTVTLTVEDNYGAIATRAALVTVKPLRKLVDVGTGYFGVSCWMEATYNWVGTDQATGENLYIISKIQTYSGGISGAYQLFILRRTSPPPSIPKLVWHIPLPTAPILRTYVTPFTPSLWQKLWGEPAEITTLTFQEGTFQGIGVTDTSLMVIVATGTETGITLYYDAGITKFDSSSPVTHLKLEELKEMWELRDIIDLLNKIVGIIGSPCELRVYDSEGHVTGLVNGEIKEEIPGSAYANDSIILLHPNETYRYEVVGIDEGTYRLLIVHIESAVTSIFNATNIPMSHNAIHQYTINWDALAQGEKGVTVQIDNNGDGTFEKAFAAAGGLTRNEFLQQIAEAFPMWIVGASVAAGAIVATAIVVYWRKRKQHPPEG